MKKRIAPIFLMVITLATLRAAQEPTLLDRAKGAYQQLLDLGVQAKNFIVRGLPDSFKKYIGSEESAHVDAAQAEELE